MHAHSAQGDIQLHSSGLALVFCASDRQSENKPLPNLAFFNNRPESNVAHK